MPRRGNIAKRDVLADPIYNSKMVTRLVNSVMLDGKKGVAQKIVYEAFSMIQEKTGNDPLETFEKAMENIMPSLECKTRRVGGANYQVPLEVSPARRETLGLRWLTAYSRSRGEKTMAQRLAAEIMDAANNTGNAVKNACTNAMGELKRLFRPELLNRIDDIVVFQKLSGENLTKIAHLLVDDLRQRLIANGMNIKLTDAAYDKIVAEGTDLTNGARPLRRAIQKLIEDPLSEELLAGEWGEGDTVLCDVADGKFVFSRGTGEIPAPRPAGTLGGDTAPAVPHTGNAAPVSGGVTSGPGGMMQAGSGAL